MDIHRSAYKHGINDQAIIHAIKFALVIIDLEPDRDPPRVLAIGPDHAGDLLEIIWLELAEPPPVVIHAMPLRRSFYRLLPTGEQDQ